MWLPWIIEISFRFPDWIREIIWGIFGIGYI